MAIYRLASDKGRMEKMEPTSFGTEGILERELQASIREHPEILEEGLLIISEEFRDWHDSNRRIDLLAIDAKRCLTVIELKRGDTGQHMDLQAIRYAAMVANMTFQQVVDTYQDHLKKHRREGDGDFSETEAEDRIREHLGNTEQDSRAIHTATPRLILVAENFSRELTTCVLWLNDSWLREAGQEIRCISLQPHRNGEELLIETKVVIPLPEASQYQTQLKKRELETHEEDALRAEVISGATQFRECIGLAAQEYRHGLERLEAFALKLENEGLADLVTYVNRKRTYIRLQLQFPGESAYWVSFNSLLFNKGMGEISFWPECEQYAPNAIKRADEIVGPVTSASGVRHRRLSTRTYDALDTIFGGIREAYQEAKGNRRSPQEPTAAAPQGD